MKRRPVIVERVEDGLLRPFFPIRREVPELVAHDGPPDGRAQIVIKVDLRSAGHPGRLQFRAQVLALPSGAPVAPELAGDAVAPLFWNDIEARAAQRALGRSGSVVDADLLEARIVQRLLTPASRRAVDDGHAVEQPLGIAAG